jgi:hypothetical protein
MVLRVPGQKQWMRAVSAIQNVSVWENEQFRVRIAAISRMTLRHEAPPEM